MDRLAGPHLDPVRAPRRFIRLIIKVVMQKRLGSNLRLVLLRLQISALVAIVVAFDQITKAWAREALADRDIHLLGLSWVSFTLTYNTGAGFGLDLGTRFPFVVIGVVAIAALLYLRRDKLDSGWERFFLALTIGGIVGNLIDREMDGKVTDFISISVWPVFNLADAALVLGICWISWREWTKIKNEQRAMRGER